MTQPRDRDFITKENDVVIEDIRIESLAGGEFSIREYVTSLGFFENIFSPFMIGDMTFTDTVGLMKKLPIIGREIVTVEYRSPQRMSLKTIRFRIIGQNSRFRTDKTRTDVISFKLMSINGYNDLNTKISRSYYGKISEIAKSVVSENLNTELADVDDTSGDFQYAFPFKRPSEMIAQMAQRGYVENDIRNVGFLFYETSSGLKFKNLLNLYTADPVNFYFDSNVRRTQELQDDFTISTHKMRNLKFGKEFNRAKQVSAGVFSTNLKSFDITRKFILNQNLSYAKDSILASDKGRGETIISEADNENYTRPKILYTNDSTSRFAPNYDDITECELYLNSNIGIHNDSQITFDISGDSLLEAGQTISIQITKNDVDEELIQEGENDEDLSTNYLIKGLGHRFYFDPSAGDEYKTAIEAVRNFRGQAVPTTTTIGD